MDLCVICKKNAITIHIYTIGFCLPCYEIVKKEVEARQDDLLKTRID